MPEYSEGSSNVWKLFSLTWSGGGVKPNALGDILQCNGYLLTRNLCQIGQWSLECGGRYPFLLMPESKNLNTSGKINEFQIVRKK